MRRLAVAVVGATATGKTAVGERLAARLRGAVVCADARQVFRELELGTGKPTPAERAARPHHLFDLHSLGEAATAGGWARAAADVCERCFAAGTLPVLVGGSGLYLSALQQGLHPEPPRDESLRARLIEECAASGVEAMHARLVQLDAETAAKLRVRDRQRVLRALEVVIAGGRPLARWREQPPEPPLRAEWRMFELVAAPAVLSPRIEQRTREMWEQGLLEEVRGIVAAGRGEALRRLAAIGYDEALDVLEGALTPEVARERMDQRTRQLAKRQRTWFRHQVQAERIEIDAAGEPGADAIVQRIAAVLGAA
jgi:tRNA dimethylallyltransferase